MKTPNNWQWNATFQHEVWPKATIEVGYVANYGYNLLRTHVGNQVLPGDSDHDGVDDRLQYVTTTPANAALRQFGVLGNTNIAIWDHEGKSNYNSLQTQFINRFGRGSQVQASYTLSRSRANIALTSSSGGLASNTTQLDNHESGSGLGPAGNRARAHLQRLGHLDALAARRPIARDARRVRRLGDHGNRGGGHRPAADGVYGFASGRLQRRPVWNRLQRQPAAQPRRQRAVPTRRADRRSRSSTRTPTR